MRIIIFVLLLGFIAGMVGVWKDYFRGQQTTWDFWINIVLSVCLLASVLYSGYEYYQTLKKERYAKVWGNFNFPTDIKDKPTIFFGAYPLNSLTIKNSKWAIEDKWEAWAEDGKINLRGTIRDRDGNIIFQIDKTEWKNWSGKDFNYDERGIEVKDSKGNIIFQLEFNKKENKISVFGVFYYDADKLILMGKDENKTIVGQSSSSDVDIHSFIKSIRPMFKYPRENHLGKRVVN